MQIEHVAVYVADLEEARGFFETYFGARAGALYHNQKTGFRSYFLSFDGGARLEIMDKPGLVADEHALSRRGYAHVAMSVGSAAAVDELTARLKADGCEVLSGPRTTGDGYYESCVLCLDGLQLEITV